MVKSVFFVKTLIAFVVFSTVVGSIYYAPYLNINKVIVLILLSLSAFAILNVSLEKSQIYCATLISFGIIISWGAFYIKISALIPSIILTMSYIYLLSICFSAQSKKGKM